MESCTIQSVEVTYPNGVISTFIAAVLLYCMSEGVEGPVIVDVIVYVIDVDGACVCLEPDGCEIPRVGV
jgi:hypothetical protein